MRIGTSPAGNDACPHALGFTLFELLLALALMAVIAGLVLPALRTPAASEVRTAASRVASMLRQTREHAVNTQREATVTVDVEQHRVEAVRGVAAPIMLPERLELALVTARSELEDDGSGRIRFFPDGSSTGGRVTVSRDGWRYFVDIDWLTGQIHLFDPGSSEDPGIFDASGAGR